MSVFIAQLTGDAIIQAVLFGAALLYVLLSLYSWRKHPAPTTRAFAWLMLAMAWWSLGYGLEFSSQALGNKVFWAKTQYPGIVAIPVLWFEYAMEYTRRERLLTRRRQGLLWIVPVIAIALSWTNEIHSLIWAEISLGQVNNLTILRLEHGPAFWFLVIYNYILIIIGSWFLIIEAWRTSHFYQAQAISILLAVLFPLVGNIIYLTGLLPDLGVDLTIFLFLPTSFILALGIARYRLLNIIPPAQASILLNLRDGILVVDQQNRVIYMNRIVEEILSKDAGDCLGKPVQEVCQPRIENFPSMHNVAETIETALTIKNQSRQFEINIAHNHSREETSSSGESFHIIVFHDITKRKKVETALLRRESILKAVSATSEYFLKSALWEKNIPNALEQLGKAAQVSRAYIFESHKSENDRLPRFSQRYEWVDSETAPQIDNADLQDISLSELGYARWEEKLAQHLSIHGLVREFPASEQDLLFAQGIRALAIVPILAENELWGFIGFDECKYERVWDEAELNALRTAADIFGAAMLRHKAQVRLLQRQQSLNLLQEILETSLSQSNLQEMSQLLVDNLGKLIAADGCFITLWDDDKKQVTPLAAYGEFREGYRNLKPQPGEKSFTSSVLEAGHTLIIDNALDSDHVSSRIASQFPTVSALVLPMLSNNRKVGAVLLGFNHRHHFTQDEITISEQATNLVTLAVDKYQAMEQAHRRAEESETLRKAGTVVTGTLELSDATSRILQQLAHVLPHDSASVQLLRDGELEIIGGQGFNANVSGMRFPIPGDNPNSKVIETREPFLLHEAHQVYPAFRSPPHDHIKSWLGVPLMVRDAVIGLLAIDSREPQRFTSADIKLVSAFAGQVAVAIENARLFNEIQRLAITDGLTGLYNRRHFLTLAQKEFERARRYKRGLSAMLFDIDHFKQINDTYGHQAGDTTLYSLANLCREKVREVDPLGRYGGEEFIGLFVETDLEKAEGVAERLRKEVENAHIETERGSLNMSISIGLAEFSPETPNLMTLINRADQALYIAKSRGRNRVAVSK